jgi:NodT family efflux transporter outer membrane factor (OMF) lipoprotein
MIARALLGAAGALSLAACVAGPAPRVASPAPELPSTFFYAPANAEGAALAALLPSEDPGFRTLAERALASSPTLAEALARIEQARAGARRAGAERLPEIGADGAVTGRRINLGQFGSALPPGVPTAAEQVSYAANVTARWDPDLFGRLRAQERAARARIDAADASARAVRIALLSEIAASVIDWRTLAARDAQLRQDLASAEELARLAGVRERAGLAPGFDRVRAESSAASSRSRLAALETERARLIGRLMTLTAQGAEPVREALALQPASSNVPPAPDTVPSALLVNRPDVLAAAATLAAEDAELAAAARRRFPVFNLSASLGLLAFGLGDLFDANSIVGTLAASVAAPLIDFGRIQAEIDGAAAEKKAAFAAYRSAVYTALGDSETAYGLIAAADREAIAARAEASSLQRAAKIAENRQRAGLADFLTVLEARRAAEASGERAAAAVGRAQRARVLLWQALGGSSEQTALLPYAS